MARGAVHERSRWLEFREEVDVALRRFLLAGAGAEDEHPARPVLPGERVHFVAAREDLVELAHGGFHFSATKSSRPRPASHAEKSAGDLPKQTPHCQRKRRQGRFLWQRAFAWLCLLGPPLRRLWRKAVRTGVGGPPRVLRKTWRGPGQAFRRSDLPEQTPPPPEPRFHAGPTAVRVLSGRYRAPPSGVFPGSAGRFSREGLSSISRGATRTIPSAAATPLPKRFSKMSTGRRLSRPGRA